MDNDLLQYMSSPSVPEKKQKKCADRYVGKDNAPYELILQTKWEDFAKYIYEVILKDIPKSERGGIGKDIRDRMWNIEALIVELGLRHGIDLAILNKIDLKVKVMLRMLTLATEIMVNKEKNIALIPKKRRETISNKLVEIGKIIGGLKRSKNAR